MTALEGSGYELFQNFSDIVPFGLALHLTHQLSTKQKKLFNLILNSPSIP